MTHVPRTRRRVALTAAALAAVIVTGGLPSAAEPPNTPGSAPGGQVVGPSATTGQDIRITLVTGDVVSYNATGSNGPTASVLERAPRPDGIPVSFVTQRDGSRVSVIPSDAMPLLQAGRVDPLLFEVSYLAEYGFADGATSELPLIVRYDSATTDTALRSAARALPGATVQRPLESVRSVAVKTAKSNAKRLWSTISAPARANRRSTALGAGVSRIWLDGKVKANLDESVPMIGAPAAWQAGYEGSGVKVAVLDTGIDPSHEDFAGRIAATNVFTGEASVQDGHGHGTHVASTIAGSGAASGGTHKGVAPKASLIIGKVLSNAGSGANSGIIAGMQWAAESGAKVVNLSLGGALRNGADDPMVQAVNALSAQYGTLFAVASGNSGPSASTIGSPGAADRALTVGAVDKSDRIAQFSSRGPSPLGSALKPDIAAPGVAITAARAAGTELGPRAGEKYSILSGTSMATPHVAGAAAILAQQHPDWSGERIKDALVSSAKDDGYGAFSQGAGRLDVTRATTQGVYADSNVDFGQLSVSDSMAARTLTYRNDTSSPVTLGLTAELSDRSGQAVPAGALTAPASVTVPAHGTQDITVTLDPSRVPGGWFEGDLVATAGAVRVAAAISADIAPAKSPVRVSVVPPAGARSVTTGVPTFMRIDNRDDLGYGVYGDRDLSVATPLAAGPWSVHLPVWWVDAAGDWNGIIATDSQFTVSGATTVTLDLRKATEVRIDTPRMTAPISLLSGYGQVRQDRIGSIAPSVVARYPTEHAWTMPVAKPAIGSLESLTFGVLGSQPVSSMIAYSAGKRPVALHPWYQVYGASGYSEANKPAMLDLTGRLGAVYAGHGTAAELAEVDARGKAVLLDLTDLCPASGCTGNAVTRVEAARDAGAKAVIGYAADGVKFLGTVQASSRARYPIPTLALTYTEGSALAASLSRHDGTLAVQARSAPEYVYALSFVTPDRIDGTHQVRADQLYQVDNLVHSEHQGQVALSWTANTPTGWTLSANAATQVPTRSKVTEYVGPVGDGVRWNRAESMLAGFTNGLVPQAHSADVFDRAGSRTQRWFAAPQVPGSLTYTKAQQDGGAIACDLCRSGPLISPLTQFVGTDPNTYSSTRFDDDFRLTRDGAEVPVEMHYLAVLFLRFPFPFFRVPDDDAEYMLTQSTKGPFDSSLYPTTVDTDWTFRSAVPDGSRKTYPGCRAAFFSFNQSECEPQRMLGLRYDAGVGLDNAVPAGRSHTFTVTGYHPIDATDKARLSSPTLKVSYDDGASWTPVPPTKTGDDEYRFQIGVPEQHQGAVSFWAEGRDSDGHAVSQKVIRGYGIRG